MKSKKFTSLTVINRLDMIKNSLSLKKEAFICPMTGGIIVVEKGSVASELINFIFSCEKSEYSISEYITGTNENISEELKLEILKNLFLKGFLVLDGNVFGTTSSKCEAHNMLLSQERKINLCVFHMHNYCNLGCEYCYMADPIIKKKIDFETMKNTARKLSELGISKINFEFHGGEPTMSMKLIREFIFEIENSNAYKFSKIVYSIQTNGYHLSDSDIEFMVNKGFNIRISLDGLEEVHDSFRRTKNNKGTYEKIISNIRTLNDYGVFPEVCCVVHEHNLKLVEEMFCNLSSLGVSGVRFLPIFRVDNLEGSYYMDGSEYALTIFNLIKYSFDINKFHLLTNLISGEVNAITSLSRNYMCMKSPCGAGIEMIGIDIDGEVYPCEEMIGDKKFSLGNIEELDISMLHQKNIVKSLHSRETSSISSCQKCIWKENCHGGCPKKSYNKFSSLDRESDMCAYYKTIFPLLVNYFHNNYKESGIYETIKW